MAVMSRNFGVDRQTREQISPLLLNYVSKPVSFSIEGGMPLSNKHFVRIK